MEFLTLNCHNCGAPLSLPETASHANCGYCGSQIVIHRAEASGGGAPPTATPDPEEELARTYLHSAIVCARNRWRRQRAFLVGRNKRGEELTPDIGVIAGKFAVVGAIVICALLLWNRDWDVLPLGIVGLVIACVLLIISVARQREYEHARAAYKSSRSRICEENFLPRNDASDASGLPVEQYLDYVEGSVRSNEEHV